MRVFHFGLVIDVVVVFNFMYNRGYVVPRCFLKLKRSLQFRVRRMNGRGAGQVSIIESKLQSIRPMAIKVGSFHTLQRVLTPTFIDSSVKNIVRLVIAIRENVK